MNHGGARAAAGRPKGSLNKTTAQLRRRINDEADPVGLLIRVARGDDLDGSVPSLAERIAAARWLGERVMPPAKEPVISVPETADLSRPGAVAFSIMRAVASGEMAPGESSVLIRVLAEAMRLGEGEASKNDFSMGLERPSMEQLIADGDNASSA